MAELHQDQQCFLLACFSPDLAPGNDEIYEEKQENFLTAGNPQDGQVVLYKVGRKAVCSGTRPGEAVVDVVVLVVV